MAAEGNTQLANYYRGYVKVIVLGRPFYLLKPSFVQNIFVWASQQELDRIIIPDNPEDSATNAKISLDDSGTRQQLDQWFRQDGAIKQLVLDLGSTIESLFSWIEYVELFDLALLTNQEGIQVKAGLRLVFKDHPDQSGNLQPGIGLNDLFRIKSFEIVVYQTAGSFQPAQLDSVVQLAQAKMKDYLSESDTYILYQSILASNSSLEKEFERIAL